MWYILRHGETMSNKKNIKQGKSDSLLTLLGIEQSRKIGDEIAKREGENILRFSIISSPVVRTRHTAQIVAEINNVADNIILDKLIASKGKGKFEGMNKDEFKRQFPSEYAAKTTDAWNYKPEGGESNKEMYENVIKFLNKYRDIEDLIIVMHKSGSAILRALLEKKSEEEIKSMKRIHDQNTFYSFDGENIKCVYCD